MKRVKIIFENLLNISKNFQMKFLTKYLTYWKDNINIQNENIETNWQTPLDVIKYIRNNLEKIGEVSMYEVYR